MSNPNPPDFGAKLKELEAITTWFESDSVDLDAALAKFERGLALAEELKQTLAQVENRVEAIKAKFEAPASLAEPAEAALDLAVDDEPTLF